MAKRLAFGRLIRVGFPRGGETTIYVVAEEEPVAAAAILRAELGRSIETEDLGRVTASLLARLNLPPDGIAKT